MGFFLLGLFAAIEIGWLVFTFVNAKQKEKGNWLKNRVIVRPEIIFELSHKWLEIRTGDMNFVLDSFKEAKEKETLSEAWFVESENTGNEIQKILSMTDTEKIGLMGHSLGGAASVTVGRERDDIDAVIDLDGTMLGEQLSYENG